MSKYNTADALVDIAKALGGNPEENLNTAELLKVISGLVEGGGGGASSVIFTNGSGDDPSFVGVTPEELKKGLDSGAPIIIKEEIIEEGSTEIQSSTVVYVDYFSGDVGGLQADIIMKMSAHGTGGTFTNYEGYVWHAETNSWVYEDQH